MQASPVNGITTAVQNGRFFPKISVVGGGQNHSLKRQEISKRSCQVAPPVWGKKNEERSVVRLCTPPLV
jgi:hypothetical protein